MKGDGVIVGADGADAAGFGNTMLEAGDVVTEYVPPNEEATAEALARRQNPAEAGAHDIAVQFANLLDMLPAPVNVPRCRHVNGSCRSHTNLSAGQAGRTRVDTLRGWPVVRGGARVTLYRTASSAVEDPSGV
jgi:hypothetical protein